MVKLIDRVDLQARAAILAAEISEYYRSRDLSIVGVREGAMPFFWTLLPQLTCKFVASTMRVRSYHGTRAGNPELKGAVDGRNVQGRDVLVVEDIIDSGQTLDVVCTKIWDCIPKSILVCTLLNKPSARLEKYRLMDSVIHWVGFEVPDQFVVGFGLDMEGRYRELPHIFSMGSSDGN